jgi:hypothetical protein
VKNEIGKSSAEGYKNSNFCIPLPVYLKIKFHQAFFGRQKKMPGNLSECRAVLAP